MGYDPAEIIAGWQRANGNQNLLLDEIIKYREENQSKVQPQNNVRAQHQPSPNPQGGCRIPTPFSIHLPQQNTLSLLCLQQVRLSTTSAYLPQAHTSHTRTKQNPSLAQLLTQNLFTGGGLQPRPPNETRPLFQPF